MSADMSGVVHRHKHLLALIITVWSCATGIVMWTNSKTLGNEAAWSPARFSNHVSLVAYGVVYIVAAVVIGVAIKGLSSWRFALLGGFVAGFLSSFIAITFIIEALQSNQGWLGAINYIFIAVIVGLWMRDILQEHLKPRV